MRILTWSANLKINIIVLAGIEYMSLDKQDSTSTDIFCHASFNL